MEEGLKQYKKAFRKVRVAKGAKELKSKDPRNAILEEGEADKFHRDAVSAGFARFMEEAVKVGWRPPTSSLHCASPSSPRLVVARERRAVL